jgi:Cd2+/Zn2+-exporting ATPase
MNPQTKLTANKTSTPTGHDESCLEVINGVVAAEPGIVEVKVDTQQQNVAFDYDPKQIAEARIEEIVDRIAPTIREHLETCTMRLAPRGGRLCESCALNLEGRLGQIQGVRQAAASYTGGVLSITYDHNLVSPNQLMGTIKRLGVSVAPSSADLPLPVEDLEPAKTWLERAQIWLTRQRLEAIFTAITFVAMSLGWLAEKLEASSAVIIVLYTLAYITGGTFGLKAGFESLRDRTIDIDILMVLAAIGAAIVGAPFEGVMLLFLFSLSNVLQDYALDRTRNAIRALMKLRPEQALVRRDSRLTTLPINQIVIGDRFVVRPGDRIPLDGLVVEGESSVDQASITGESMPVAKGPGDMVLAGTINKNGSLETRVTKLAKDSTISKMIRLVEEAQSKRARTQRFLDTAEQYYAMGVIGFTLLAIIVPVLVFGEAFQTAFYRAMTLMVAASPCALVISTPASILSAIGNGARKGVLFKGGAYMEQAAGIKVVAFDKTGTLTEGKPRVTDVMVITPPSGPPNGRWQGAENDLLALAATVETRSEHVLGQATVEAANHRSLELSDALAFEATTGKGVRGRVNGLDIRIGSLRYFEEFTCFGWDIAATKVERFQTEGKTSVVIAQMNGDGRTAHILGVIAYADTLRVDAAAAVRELKALGVERVVMLTGDNDRVARAIAAEVGVDDYYADLLPENKLDIIKELEVKYGLVAMVGDGVNDAPALATAPIGVAMGAAGTDVALETADVVLLADDLSNIPYVIALSRQTRRTLVVNLGFATAMIAIMIAAIFTANLSLPLAVLGHEGGTVLVSLNGLRLLAYKRKP